MCNSKTRTMLAFRSSQDTVPALEFRGTRVFRLVRSEVKLDRKAAHVAQRDP